MGKRFIKVGKRGKDQLEGLWLDFKKGLAVVELLMLACAVLVSMALCVVVCSWFMLG